MKTNHHTLNFIFDKRYNITVLHAESPENLCETLKKIYQIVSKDDPLFIQIIPSINESLLSLGCQKGISYAGLISQKDQSVKTEAANSSQSSVTKLFESSDNTMYKINGRIWTKQIINSPEGGFFNNYSSRTQYGDSSSVEYVSPSCIDGQITKIVVRSQEIYYPLEDKVVSQKSLLVKSGLKTVCSLDDPYDIKQKLLSFVGTGHLDKEFVEVFF